MFKSVLNFEGIYQINEQTEVFRILEDGTRRQMTPSLNRKGYLTVCLTKNGKQKTVTLHKLIWEAFNGPVPKGYVLHHLDKCKLHNSLSNIICLTKKEHDDLHKDEATNKSRSQKLKGHEVSEYAKKIQSEVNMNNKHALGHVVSEQARKRMSQAHMGRKFSQQTKRKMSESHKRKGV